jgi:hypothetical protein
VLLSATQIATGATAAAPLGNLVYTDLLRFVLKPQLDAAVTTMRRDRDHPRDDASGSSAKAEDAIAAARRAIAAGAPTARSPSSLARDEALATLDSVAAALR